MGVTRVTREDGHAIADRGESGRGKGQVGPNIYYRQMVNIIVRPRGPGAEHAAASTAPN